MRISDCGMGVVLLVVGACARSPQPTTQPAVATSTAPAAAPSRPRPYPVFETRDFARAVERGTRTRAGRPGPGYWQQYATYRLEAAYDPATKRLTGRGTMRYTNRSPDTLGNVFLHLYANLFAPDAMRNEPVPVTGGVELRRIAIDGRPVGEAPNDTAAGYEVFSTILRVRPPGRILPGATVQVDAEWQYTVPPDGAPRGGDDGEVAYIAYWYPQFAVYDDVARRWQTDPYMGTAEFYMGYGDYDVSITVPDGWLVAATGELTNAADVLSAQTRARLDTARRSRDITHVVAEADRGAGKATARGRDGKLTWRFRATNVRDFAFGTSDKYLWDATVAVAGDATGDGRSDTAAIHTFWRPQRRAWAWDQSARYAQHSIEFLSRYLWPYPYPHMTAVDGVVSCSGMEYPMMTCIGGRRDTLALYSVTVHEIAHMWFPMQVGSDEKRFSWQDEGLTRFNQAQGMQEFFPGYDRESLSRTNYLNFARSGGEVELMRHGDLYPIGSAAFGIASYDKMAINLRSLRALLGDELFLRAYREYGRRWINKHPTPYDFWNTFEDVVGRDLDWFWTTWWFETWTLDQAVSGAREEGDALVVTIEDRGLAPMPVRLAITRADGSVERMELPVDPWLAGARTQTARIGSAATVRSVEIDPELAFPDVDRANNRWEQK
ncbi:MAG TPA: M1 family metallopeptidase [Gemmatimonadaceae bacterium]|nr:M1 family metallopeptidase [Gemmatimonadaceae bacterium]